MKVGRKDKVCQSLAVEKRNEEVNVDKDGQNLTFSKEEEKVKEHLHELINAVINDELSITETGCILYLNECKNITELSKKLGVSRQTIYNCLKKDKVKNAITTLREETFKASFERLRDLNLRAVAILQNGLNDEAEKYSIAKFIINASLKLLEVEKKKIQVSEEKKKLDKETGEEQKKTVSSSAEKTFKT